MMPLCDVKDLSYSGKGFDLTEREELFRRDAYQDVVGVWTIAWGHTRGVYKGMVCDKPQGLVWLKEDLASAEENVKTHVTVQVTQGEYDALVDFDFNLGDGSLDRSTLLKLLNGGEWAKAAEEFVKWDHAGGRELAGLLRRRLEEKEMFLNTGDNV